MTPQELKNSILQLAIQGKLVEQRPEEGTGAELVEKIFAAKNAEGAKENLTRSRGVRGEKNTSALSAPPREEIPDPPFEIPESWVWVRIGDVFKLQAGKNIRSEDIYHEFSPEHRHKCYGGNGSRGYVADYNRTGHHVLIGRQGALCGNINYADGEFYATEHAVVVEQFAGTDVYWCGYFLKALNLNQHATATAQPGLAVAKINLLPIPLPPLAEQKRIVAKIEELLPLIDRYEKAWAKLEEFNRRFPVDMQKSLLQMAIQGKLVEQRPEEGTGAELLEKISHAETRRRGERKGKSNVAKPSSRPSSSVPPEEQPFDIPESWVWVRLGNVGSWTSGATPSRTHAEYYGGHIPWLKTGDLNDGYISNIPETITDLALEKTSVRLNPVGSVLMAMYGATIGKLGILQVAATTNQACCACIPYDGMWNKYLFYYLLARRRAFIKMGEGGAQPNISKEKIVNAPIPLPPLAEQKRIVARLEEILPLCERLKSCLVKGFAE